MDFADILPGVSGAPDIHPMFVHFPIALWIAALASQLVACLGGPAGAAATARWLLYGGTASAVVTAFTGFLAADRMGHGAPGHELVHVHRNFMLAATGIAAAGCVLAFLLRRRATRAARWALAAVLLVLAGVTTLGADRGAALVYVHGAGTPAGITGPDHGRGDHDH